VIASGGAGEPRQPDRGHPGRRRRRPVAPRSSTTAHYTIDAVKARARGRRHRHTAYFLAGPERVQRACNPVRKIVAPVGDDGVERSAAHVEDLAPGARARARSCPCGRCSKSRRCRRPRLRRLRSCRRRGRTRRTRPEARVERVELAVVGAEVDGRLEARDLGDGGGGVDEAARRLPPHASLPFIDENEYIRPSVLPM